MRLLLLVCLSGCGSWSDFAVDATDFAAEHPGVVLRVKVIALGDELGSYELDFDEQTSLTVPDLLRDGQDIGIAAWADLDGDRRCDLAPDDVAWLFVDLPWKETVRWVVDAAVGEADTGCFWFDSEEIDTAEP